MKFLMLDNRQRASLLALVGLITLTFTFLSMKTSQANVQTPVNEVAALNNLTEVFVEGKEETSAQTSPQVLEQLVLSDAPVCFDFQSQSNLCTKTGSSSFSCLVQRVDPAGQESDGRVVITRGIVTVSLDQLIGNVSALGPYELLPADVLSFLQAYAWATNHNKEYIQASLDYSSCDTIVSAGP